MAKAAKVIKDLSNMGLVYMACDGLLVGHERVNWLVEEMHRRQIR